MIIRQNNNKKIELVQSEPNKLYIIFYINNELVIKVSLEREEEYLLDTVSKYVIDCLNNSMLVALFISRGLYSNILRDIEYVTNLLPYRFSFYKVYLYTIDDSELKILLPGAKTLWYSILSSRINENDIYAHILLDKKSDFDSIKNLTLKSIVSSLSYRDTLYINTPPEKEVCFDVSNETKGLINTAVLVFDYGINFLVSAESYRKILALDYLNSINFFETGHLFLFNEEQCVELAKMKLLGKVMTVRLEDGDGIIIKSIKPDGIIEF